MAQFNVFGTQEYEGICTYEKKTKPNNRLKCNNLLFMSNS